MPFTGVKEVTPDWPTPNRVFDPARAHELYRSYVETMVYAEQCGFDWVGCNEHHFSPYGLMANCNLVGGALVYPTKKIRIAMMGNLVPLNNPIRVAEEYAMLDCMSGGRLVAGLMRGIPHEYIAYNVAPDSSWSRQREAIALILKAWTEPEPFGWEGEHFQFRQVSIWPRPLQKPHPPLVISASSLESARFAG
jgi:alkanesulfonate monooxygenase SsuD/methylene tetrahydromethanopterin reductase-like flavin-dependent oxidoreductase (luciferase family)